MTQPPDTGLSSAFAFRPYTVPTMNASGALQPAGELLLGGWSFAETSGAAAAVIQLLDGGASGGTVILELALPAGGTETRPAPEGGIWIRSGLTLNVLSGSVRGSIWVARPDARHL